MKYDDHTIKFNGFEISYIDNKAYGKPILVLIHGWMACKESFWPLIAALGKEHHIIAPDLPGFGKSSGGSVDMEISDYSEVVKLFLSKLELKNYHVLGNSLGGDIAIHLANNNQSARKLILRAPYISSDQFHEILRIVSLDEGFVRISRNKTMLKIMQKFFRWMFIKLIQPTNTKDVYQRAYSIMRISFDNVDPVRARYMIQSAIFGKEAGKILAGLSQEVLIIGTKSDELMDYDKLDGKFQYVELESNHSILRTDNIVLAEQVIRFLG